MHLFFLAHSVADAANGFYAGTGLAQFFPQAEDLYIHGPGRDDIFIAPAMINDLLPAEDPAGLSCQLFQDGKFRGGQVDGPSCYHYLMSSAMDGHGMGGDNFFYI